MHILQVIVVMHMQQDMHAGLEQYLQFSLLIKTILEVLKVMKIMNLLEGQFLQVLF